MPVNGITSQRLVPGLIEQIGSKVTAPRAEEGKPPAFADMVTDLIESVNQAQIKSGQMQEAFLAGEPVELHQLMIKAEEAGVATDLLLEIRNRLLDAYREIMKMPM